MKPKSTLRAFLAIAGSLLLAVTASSAGTYYWDSNGDGTAGFGALAGTWASAGTGNLWSTSPTGDGVGGAAVADYATTTSDTVNISTSGLITVSGIVDVGTLKLPLGGGNLNGGTINFPAVGTIECSKANGNIGSAITGAGTSLTIFANNENLAFWTATTSVNNGAAKTIIQQGATPGQGRFGVAEEQNLGPISSILEFDGGVLRIIPQTVTPASQLKSFGLRTVNFVGGKNVEFNVNGTNLVFTCNKVLNQGAGGLIQSGNANGYLILNQTNTYTGTTEILAGFMSVSDSANLGDITAPLTFNGGKLQITGTSFTSFGARTVNQIAAKAVDLDIADAANTFTFDKILNGTSALNKKGTGTLVINQDNTFTATSFLIGGGTVVLDYTTNGGSKFSDGNAITLGNSDLTLKNGSHPEIVQSLTLNAGNSHIARDGGSSTINLNNIPTRAAGGTISFSATSIATTDKLNTNGILGGWATVGTNWAKNSTNALDSPITALVAPGDYTAMPTVLTASTTANYNLAGGATLTGNVSGQSVRIENTGDDQILDLGANTLTFVAINGGLLYAGGSNGKYTINGTGQLKNSAANSEMIFNTAAGTLTVSAPLGIGAGVLTKAGTGTLVLNTAVAGGTGVTHVNQGTLLVNTTTTSTGIFTVYNKAKLGGTGEIDGSTVINSGGGLTFDLITATGSHDSLDLAATKTLTFPFTGSGGSTSLTITSTGGTPATGTYTLVTAPGGILGAVPSTVTLPGGWTAGAPYIDGTSLKIDIIVPVASGYASWKAANAGGQDPDLDFDNDGVDNGVEYFMNASVGFTASPALNSLNVITWPNGGNILPGAYGTEFVIQTSSDLSGWLNVDVGDLTTNTPGPGGSLTYALTGAAPRFVRLKVTPN